MLSSRLPGLGARGIVDGREVMIGRAKLAVAIPADLAGQCRTWRSAGCSAVLVGWDGAVHGGVAVAGTLKLSAAPAIDRRRALGLHPILLTGHNEASAGAVASAAGINEVIADTLPDGKAAVITALHAAGHQVAMVGDGISDAPALAAADLGLALGSGTDVACAARLILLSVGGQLVTDGIRGLGGEKQLPRQLRCSCLAALRSVVGLPPN